MVENGEKSQKPNAVNSTAIGRRNSVDRSPGTGTKGKWENGRKGKGKLERILGIGGV